MEKIPVFNEYGVILNKPSKIPAWVWYVVAFVVGGFLTYLFLSPKKEKEQEPQPPIQEKA